LFTPKQFKYEWVTKLDKDAESREENSWHLVAATGTLKVSLRLAQLFDMHHKDRNARKILTDLS
jgi:hypothetical protein